MENTHYTVSEPDERGYVTIRPDSGYVLRKKTHVGEERLYSVVICKEQEVTLFEAVRQGGE